MCLNYPIEKLMHNNTNSTHNWLKGLQHINSEIFYVCAMKNISYFSHTVALTNLWFLDMFSSDGT